MNIDDTMLLSINKRVEFLAEELTQESRLKQEEDRKKDEALTTQMAKYEAAIERLKNDNKRIDDLNNTFT